MDAGGGCDSYGLLYRFPGLTPDGSLSDRN